MQKNKFEIIAMPPENTVSVLVHNGTECVIFDAWGRAKDWQKLLDERQLKLNAIYSTHGHPDHISAAPDLARLYNVPWFLHQADWGLVGWGNDLLEYFGLPAINPDVAKPDYLDVNINKILDDLDVQIIEMPGHTPGGVAYYFPSEKVLLIGDSIFQTSIGRYDLPGGSLPDLMKSIAKIYNMNLPESVQVIHGHGPATDIGFLCKNNTFFHK